MTGRGLALVGALSQRWGYELVSDGKIVWAEIGPDSDDVPTDAEIDELIDAWDDDFGDDRLVTVHLGDVPTDLLLSAKAHIDNVVREFTLAASGALTGSTAAVPPHLAELIDTVVHGFTDARQAIKRQALAADAAGHRRTTLTLRLPIDAADAGERYLVALDEADAYARAARLLTLETPPQHRVFRRWYVESLVDQLRAVSAGETPTLPQTFEERLLEELGAVAAGRAAAERTARLQGVTAALARATTVEEVASVVVSEGVVALDASGGALLVPSEDERHLSAPVVVGYGDDVAEVLRNELREADLPAAQAIRSGDPVWLASRDDRDEAFPALRGLEPGTLSLCAVPLVLVDRVLGALRFSFSTPRLFDDREREFVLALAAQTAQAVERSHLYEAERTAREAAESFADRLLQLQQITARLTAARDVDDVLDLSVRHALAVVRATGAFVELETPDGVRRVVEIGDIDPSEGAELVNLPLKVGERSLGSMTLVFPADFRDAEDPGVRRFLIGVADATAQAMDRSSALDRAEQASNRLSFLAEASTVLAGTLDYRATLTNLAQLLVPRVADWCAVHVREGDRLELAAIAHVDPAMADWAVEMERRFPLDLSAATGAPKVIRTGASELYPTVPHDLLVSGAVNEEHLRLIDAVGMRSALVVALPGRDAPLGALTLVHAESGRRFDATDLALAEDVARRAGLALENARLFREQSGRLAAVQRVAETVQHAILAPVPPVVGPVRLSARYVSAAEEALIGGDLYEVIGRAGAARLVIGDVRGKGLEAVRLATFVLGEFRGAALDEDDLIGVASQIDRRLAPHLTDEDFVTALIAEISHDGLCRIVSCGHPAPLLIHDGQVSSIAVEPGTPLGLGAAPTETTTQLRPRDRLLFYTDGLVEARDQAGRFANIHEIVRTVADGALDEMLDNLLARLHVYVGAELGDDLALVVAEYNG